MQQLNFNNMVNRFHSHLQQERLMEIERLKNQGQQNEIKLSEVPEFKEVETVFNYGLFICKDEIQLKETIAHFYSLRLGYYVDHIF